MKIFLILSLLFNLYFIFLPKIKETIGFSKCPNGFTYSQIPIIHFPISIDCGENK